VKHLTLGDKEEEFLLQAKPEQGGGEDSVTVLGLKGLLTTMGRCCNPAPGDEIVGYITRGRGATIHRRDCPNILRVDDRDRLIKVGWVNRKPHSRYQ